MCSHNDDNPPAVDNAFHPVFLALAERQDLRRAEPELLKVLDLALAMARTPESLALLLEAVGPGTLEAAGRILARRVAGEG